MEGPCTLEGHRGMGAGQMSLCWEEGSYLWMHRWSQIGFEYLRNLDYIDYYCVFVCGTKFLNGEGRQYKGDTWKNREMLEG